MLVFQILKTASIMRKKNISKLFAEPSTHELSQQKCEVWEKTVNEFDGNTELLKIQMKLGIFFEIKIAWSLKENVLKTVFSF